VKNDEESTDIKDDYKKVDFSWAFGASYVSNSGLGVDARYNLGISNINDDASKNKKQGIPGWAVLPVQCE
jgi:hypothetical protein